jgi:hypothetical protein
MFRLIRSLNNYCRENFETILHCCCVLLTLSASICWKRLLYLDRHHLNVSPCRPMWSTCTGMRIFASSLRSTSPQYLYFAVFGCGLDFVLPLHNVWIGHHCASSSSISFGRDDERRLEAYPSVVVCESGKRRRNSWTEKVKRKAWIDGTGDGKDLLHSLLADFALLLPPVVVSYRTLLLLSWSHRGSGSGCLLGKPCCICTRIIQR